MTRTYARVYHEIVDDPKFERVYDNDAALACWLRCLLLADATYPMPAPIPRRNSAFALLVDVGLIEERTGHRFTVKGLAAERERRSEIGRNAADVRWQSKGNANAMPSRAEQSKDEQIGAKAPENGAFMGFRAKPAASLEDVRRQEEEAWTSKCADCGTLKRKHPSGGEHPFRAELRSVS